MKKFLFFCMLLAFCGNAAAQNDRIVLASIKSHMECGPGNFSYQDAFLGIFDNSIGMWSNLYAHFNLRTFWGVKLSPNGLPVKDILLLRRTNWFTVGFTTKASDAEIEAAYHLKHGALAPIMKPVAGKYYPPKIARLERNHALVVFTTNGHDSMVFCEDLQTAKKLITP